MAGSYLLDTNIISGWYRGEIDVPSRLSDGGTAYLSAIVAGELLYGIQSLQGARRNRLQGFVDDVLVTFQPVLIDVETSLQYAVLKDRLRVAGRKIPENDLWIAATGLRHGLTVVTRDEHFSYVQGLANVRW